MSETSPLFPASQGKSSRRRSPSFQESADKLCERGIVGAVLAILILGPLAYGAVRANPEYADAPHLYGFLVIQGLTAFALLLWAARCFTQRPFRLLWPPICWAVAAFLLYAFVRCRTAELDYVARQNFQCVAVYGALFFVVLHNFQRRESATLAALALIALGLGESLFAFCQYTTHYAKIWHVLKPAGYAMRGSGTYVNPNNFAGFTEMVLPLALAYTVMGRFKAPVRVLLGYGALVMMAGLVMSQSRGGLLAAGVTLAVFCVVLLYQADYWRRGALALAALAVAGLVLLQQFGTVENRFAGGLIDPGDGRNFYWAAAEKIFHSHVLRGAGPGSFRYLYPMTASLYAQVEPTNAHNDYLNTLCEWGLAGFALVIAALGLLFAGVTRIWPYVRRGSGDLGAKDSSRAAFVLGATLGLLSISIHSLVDFNMQIPANAITAIVLMALLSAHWRFGTERFWFNPGKFGKPLLALAAAAAAWFLASEGLREQSEFHWLKQARNQTLPFSGRIAALETAQKIEPRNFMTCCQLGETYRIEAWRGETGNEELARQGLQWFQRGQDLNPYNCQPPLGIGLCLDWLDRPHEATRYFLQALEVNPNNAVVQWKLAWHCMVLRNYPLARFWLERSLYWVRTPEALAYFEIVNEKLAEEAAHPPPPGRE